MLRFRGDGLVAVCRGQFNGQLRSIPGSALNAQFAAEHSHALGHARQAQAAPRCHRAGIKTHPIISDAQMNGPDVALDGNHRLLGAGNV